MITSQEKQDIEDVFEDADVSLIDEIIFFDGWCSYEESGGHLIFRGIDGTIQCADYGYSVMTEDNRNFFDLTEISEETCKETIADMKEAMIWGETN